MQANQVQRETSDLFDMNFMGKLNYVLKQDKYFGTIVAWRDDDPAIFEIIDEEKFLWTIVPFLISPNSTIFTWHETINSFGFVPAFVQYNPNKMYRKPGLDRTSNRYNLGRFREAWIRQWQRVRIERYFNRSQEGLMYKALKVHVRFRQNGSRNIQWQVDGYTIEIRNIEDFVRKQIDLSSMKSVKSFITRLRSCRFQTKARTSRSDVYLIRHPLLNEFSPVEAWFNIFEWAAFKSRLAARMRRELKSQIDKETFLDRVEPPPEYSEPEQFISLPRSAPIRQSRRTDHIVTFEEKTKEQWSIGQFKNKIEAYVDQLYKNLTEAKQQHPDWQEDIRPIEKRCSDLLESINKTVASRCAPISQLPKTVQALQEVTFFTMPSSGVDHFSRQDTPTDGDLDEMF